MDVLKAFKIIRDMPYRIPLTLDENDVCCSGKHSLLRNIFSAQGFKVRYRVCSFLWSTFDLPNKVLAVAHNDLSSHVWLEVLIDGEWITVDATWDTGIKEAFHVNEWNGKSNTKIAVKPLEIFTPQKSADIMNNETEKEILDDLKINGEFYKTFNNWLDELRISE